VRAGLLVRFGGLEGRLRGAHGRHVGPHERLGVEFDADLGFVGFQTIGVVFAEGDQKVECFGELITGHFSVS
jgi:hypothetical protein